MGITDIKVLDNCNVIEVKRVLCQGTSVHNHAHFVTIRGYYLGLHEAEASFENCLDRAGLVFVVGVGLKHRLATVNQKKD